MKEIKVLFISSLFPNKEQPARGMYNFYQIKHLAKLCDVKVIAPFFWFPMMKRGNKGAVLKNIPFFENNEGLDTYHPKVFYTPKIMRNLYGIFYFLSLVKMMKRIRKEFDFDCIYTNWLYPDAYAARIIAKRLKKPYIAMGLGTDINEYLFCPVRGRKILKVIRDSYKTFTVSRDLYDKVRFRGVSKGKLDVLYDGVDGSIFSSKNSKKTCERLGLNKDKKRILYVGSFEVWKGPHLLVEAIDILKRKHADIELILIGQGPEEQSLRRMVQDKGLSDNVVFGGVVPNKDLNLWINTSKVVCIPSTSEGVPNVMLESLSCGVPVVASKVGGIPEVITDERLGMLLELRSSSELAGALEKAVNIEWDKDFIKNYSSKFSWDENARHLFDAIQQATGCKV